MQRNCATHNTIVNQTLIDAWQIIRAISGLCAVFLCSASSGDGGGGCEGVFFVCVRYNGDDNVAASRGECGEFMACWSLSRSPARRSAQATHAGTRAEAEGVKQNGKMAKIYFFTSVTTATYGTLAKLQSNGLMANERPADWCARVYHCGTICCSAGERNICCKLFNTLFHRFSTGNSVVKCVRTMP